MQKKHYLMIGIGVGALFLGKKLYTRRKEAKKAKDEAAQIGSHESFDASNSQAWTPVEAATVGA